MFAFNRLEPGIFVGIWAEITVSVESDTKSRMSCTSSLARCETTGNPSANSTIQCQYILHYTIYVYGKVRSGTTKALQNLILNLGEQKVTPGCQTFFKLI